MKVEVCRPHELGRTEVDAWHAFQRLRGLTNPFLSPEFADAADVAFPNARVAVVYDAEDLVGFLPFMSRSLRTATAIADDMSNVQAFIHADGQWPLAEIVGAAGLNLLEFHSLVGGQSGGARGVLPMQSFVIDLAAGFDTYRAATRVSGGSFFKELMRKQRRLEREDPEARFEFSSRDPGAIDTLCGWKSAQYQRTGQRDRLARAGVRELVERVAYADTDAMRAQVSALRSADHIMSVGLALRGPGVLAGWLSAYNVADAAVSPGALRWIYLIEAAAADGIGKIDLSSGAMDYKLRLANDSAELATCWVGRPSIGRAVRRLTHRPVEQAFRFVAAHPRAGELVSSSRHALGAARGHRAQRPVGRHPAGAPPLDH